MKIAFLLPFLTVMLFYSCGNNTQNGHNSNSDKINSDTVTNKTDTATKDSVAYLQDANFKSLTLSKSQFDHLYSLNGKNKDVLVFQFYYPSTYAADQSPNLAAYVMSEHHVKIADNAFEVLNYFGSSSEPLYGREQFLGDQQVSIKEMRDLIKSATGREDGKYSSFLFTPHIDNNKHIYYEITIVDAKLTSGSVKTNPSPPATAG